MVFLILLLVPLVILAGAYFLWKEVTWKEALIQVGAQAVVAGISALIVYHSTVGDTEVWNGTIAHKQKERVSCSHSYSCNCRETCSGSGKDRSCSQTCDTCYEHSNDYDWNIITSNGEVVTIDRVDRQGNDMPPRYKAAEKGEPTAVSHRYTNYVKGSPDTLFRRQGQLEKFKDQIPKYPEVFDYYRMNRFISSVGGQNPNDWNNRLAQLNSELGDAKQVNMIVVLTTAPAEFFYALEEAWIGGKKNDVVLVIGIDTSNKPVWANTMAWTDKDIFKVRLRDAIMALPEVTPEAVVPVLGDAVRTDYVRKPMAEYEYLKASISPSMTQWVISLIIGFLFSAGLTYGLHRYRHRHRHHRSSFGRHYGFRRFT